MGLELSLARLKALAKFAFGLGLTQVCVILQYPISMRVFIMQVLDTCLTIMY